MGHRHEVRNTVESVNKQLLGWGFILDVIFFYCCRIVGKNNCTSASLNYILQLHLVTNNILHAGVRFPVLWRPGAYIFVCRR